MFNKGDKITFEIEAVSPAEHDDNVVYKLKGLPLMFTGEALKCGEKAVSVSEIYNAGKRSAYEDMVDIIVGRCPQAEPKHIAEAVLRYKLPQYEDDLERGWYTTCSTCNTVLDTNIEDPKEYTPPNYCPACGAEIIDVIGGK